MEHFVIVDGWKPLAIITKSSILGVAAALDSPLVMTNEDNENIGKSTKCWICDQVYVDGDVKVTDHCHINGKYRGSAHRDCNINVRLSHKILIVFHNLKNYGSHLIMQELGKFNFKLNVIPNGLEK